jgi:3-oxoacyl-[acyl-carrier protein] reductase
MATGNGHRGEAGDGPPVALVTGGSGALGGEIAGVLSRRGYTVAVHACTDVAAAERVCAGLSGPSAVVVADITDADQVTAMVAGAREHGPVDVVVNAAGHMTVGLLAAQRIDDWRRTVDVNLVGPYLVCRAALPTMLRRRRGRIVNIVSPAADRASPGQTAYSASKAGLIGMTRSLAVECAKRGVTVNAVSPGFVDSKMTAALPARTRAMLIDRVPLGRVAEAAEVARAVEFILGCDYLTGQVITVDGGLAL